MHQDFNMKIIFYSFFRTYMVECVLHHHWQHSSKQPLLNFELIMEIRTYKYNNYKKKLFDLKLEIKN